MLGVLKIFFRAPGSNAWLVLACLIGASLAEGVGIASLLPLIATIVDSPSAEASPFYQTIIGTLDALGLPREFGILLLIVISGSLLKEVMTLFAMRYVGFAVAEVSTILRGRIIDSVLQARWPFFISQPVGRITTAAGSETNGAVAAFRTAAEFLAYTTQTAIYVVIAFLVSWQMTLSAVAIGAFILLILNYLVEAGRRAGHKQTLHTRGLMTHLTDLLNNIKPLKAMARQEASASYLDKKVLAVRRAMRKGVTATVFLKHFQEMLIVVSMGAGLFAAVTFLKIELAELLVMIVVIVNSIKNLAKMQRQYQKAASLEAPYEAVHKFIKDAVNAEEKLHGGREPALETSVEINNLSFSFGQKQVLKGLSLEVPARGATVLMGASGGGKTTLIDLLLGFYEPEEGEILVDDVPLPRIDLRKWRRVIGYVPQEIQLFHDSVAMNVSLGDPSIDQEAVRQALDDAGALAFVDALPEGIHSKVGERGSQLSGGQRQRIALARALVTQPRLLILDEVTSALDPITEREICATLKRLSQNMTILAITHQPQMLSIANRAYRIENGRAQAIDLSSRVAV